MSRKPADYTEEQLLKIAKKVDPATIPRGRDTDWIQDDQGKQLNRDQTHCIKL